MGMSALKKCQIGKETVKGTAVAATAALLGQLTMRDEHIIHRPNEARGNLADFNRSVKVGNLAKLSFEGDATFEQILYWLHMGILGNVTPTGAGSAKTWTFTPAMTAAGVFDAFTLEAGDDVQAAEVEYCMAREIEISFGMAEPTRVKVDIFGRKLTATTFTGSLTPPTVETIAGQKWKLYIDNDIAVPTTEVATSLISGSFKIKTGLYPKRRGDGSLDFTAYGEQVKGVELKLTVDYNAAIEAERLKYDGATIRCVRLKNIGSLISGSDYKNLILDVSGIWTDFPELSEQDGSDIVSVTLSSQRAVTYTKLFEVVVINAVAALP